MVRRPGRASPVSAVPVARRDGADHEPDVRLPPRRDSKDPAGGHRAGSAGLGGPTPTDEAYPGRTLHVVAMDGEQGAYATTPGGVLLAGDVASVKAAVDRERLGRPGRRRSHSGPRWPSRGRPARPDATSTSRATSTRCRPRSRRWPRRCPDSTCAAAPRDRLPAWAAAGLRVDEDALVGTSADAAIRPTPTIAERRERASPRSVPAIDRRRWPRPTTAARGSPPRWPAAGRTRRPPTPSSRSTRPPRSLGGIDAPDRLDRRRRVRVIADGTTPSVGLVVVPTDADQGRRDPGQPEEPRSSCPAPRAGSPSREEPYAGGTITVDRCR